MVNAYQTRSKTRRKRRKRELHNTLVTTYDNDPIFIPPAKFWNQLQIRQKNHQEPLKIHRIWYDKTYKSLKVSLIMESEAEALIKMQKLINANKQKTKQSQEFKLLQKYIQSNTNTNSNSQNNCKKKKYLLLSDMLDEYHSNETKILSSCRQLWGSYGKGE